MTNSQQSQCLMAISPQSDWSCIHISLKERSVAQGKVRLPGNSTSINWSTYRTIFTYVTVFFRVWSDKDVN